MNDEYNIEDFGHIDIAYNKYNPDALLTAHLLYRIWGGMCDVSKTQITLTSYGQYETIIGSAPLQVCLDVLPSHTTGQLICVSSDIATIKKIQESIKSIRDLDKYGVNSIVYTPYSISHFILNYTKQCILQDIKGINFIPYLPQDQYSIDLESYDDDVATMIYIECPDKERLPEDFKLDTEATLLYTNQYWHILDNRPVLPLVSSYVLSKLKDEDYNVIVRNKGIHYLVDCKTMTLHSLNDLDTSGFTDEELERILFYL